MKDKCKASLSMSASTGMVGRVMCYAGRPLLGPCERIMIGDAGVEAGAYARA